MKKIACWMFVLCLAVTSMASTNVTKFANIKNQERADVVPVPSASEIPPQYQGNDLAKIWPDVIRKIQLEKGWREVSLVLPASEGCVIEEYSAEDIDGEHCRLVVKSELNLKAVQDAAVATEEERMAAVERMKRNQIEAKVVTPAVVNGMIRAVLQEVNKRVPFDKDPITIEAVLSNMEVTVTEELQK